LERWGRGEFVKGRIGEREIGRWQDGEMGREGEMMDFMKIRDHTDLDVFNMAFDSAMEIFEISKKFPNEEKYSLTDQIRRSSRSVAANISEAFRKRKYPKAFVSKLSDCEAEAAETQVWLKFSFQCGYINKVDYNRLIISYNNIIGKLVNMAREPHNWTI